MLQLRRILGIEQEVGLGQLLEQVTLFLFGQAGKAWLEVIPARTALSRILQQAKPIGRKMGHDLQCSMSGFPAVNIFPIGPSADVRKMNFLTPFTITVN